MGALPWVFQMFLQVETVAAVTRNQESALIFLRYMPHRAQLLGVRGVR
jgi:hypothetical protein